MPSLKALEEFKSSFILLGSEPEVMADLNLPLDVLLMPENEPEALPEPASDPVEITDDSSEEGMDLFGGLDDLLGGMDSSISDDDTTLTGDDTAFSDAALDDVFEEQESPEELSLEEPGFEDQSLDELSLEEPGFEDQSLDEFSLEEPGFEDQGFDELNLEEAPAFEDLSPDADFGDTSSPDESELGSLPDFDAVEDISGQDLPEFDNTEMSFDVGTSSDLAPADDFPGFEDQELEQTSAGDEFEAYELDEETPPPEEIIVANAEADENGFGFDPDEKGFGPEAFLEDSSSDSFDSFSPDFGSTEFGLGDDFAKMEDFPIPGLDIEELSIDTKISDNGIEEISLSNEDLEKFLTTVSSYPLNLRVACEELIAEQAVEPDKMSKLVNMLINGAPAIETAEFAGRLLDRKIGIHRDFEKKTGEELEAEQASFAYIFVHNFLPVFRLFLLIGTLVFSVAYLSWQFIYKPIRADRIYKMGIERIHAGQYSRANERFWEAFEIHEKQSWFFEYARAFRDARQYTLAEEKYLQLFTYSASKSRRGIPDKAAVLEYADLLANYIGNYELADWVIWRNILDHVPWDYDALLAVGDINLMWGEYDPSRLEYARQAYAKIIEQYGSTDPLLERMLKYFIRIDDLEQVLLLQLHFMENGTPISAITLTEMGAYFLDKRQEEVRGVPNEFLGNIGGIREILIRSLQLDPMLPETYYHLARYYQYLGNTFDESATLEMALRAFDYVREESPNRIRYHILALRRYAELLTGRREFFNAEEHLVKGINLYQNGLARRIISPSPELGRLYADMGDLEFFTKDGNMPNVLNYYHLSESHGWAPPEIHFRMGVAYYQLSEWGPALQRFTDVHREVPLNHRVLYALGNASYMRGNYFAAQGYFDRLLEMLAAGRERFPVITPTDDTTQLQIAERIMIAQNNLGVTLEALTERTGNNTYRTRAQGHFTDSLRAWDVVTRNPVTMFRLRPSDDINAPGVNPAFLNVQNSLNPVPGFQHHFFLRIDNDIFDQSRWEELAPPGFSLSEGIHTGR